MNDPERGPTDDDESRWEYAPADADPVGAWARTIATLDRQGWSDEAERMKRGGPPPEPGTSPLVVAPAVAALEVGHDPGGAIAVALAAIGLPTLALLIVIGSEESARYARHLLDLLGRDDVAVVLSGAPSSGATTTVSCLIPPHVPAPDHDVARAVRAVTARTPYLILWANHGPLTDLAAALAADPALAGRLACRASAGPLHAPAPSFASDPVAAAMALAVLREPSEDARDPRTAAGRLPPSGLTTLDPAPFAVGPGSALHRELAAPHEPPWAHLLSAHLDMWFAEGHMSVSLYPAVTVANLMELYFIVDVPQHVRVDQTGQLIVDPAGQRLWVTASLDSGTFLEWLRRELLGRARRG